jgi:hypothetical protein
MRVLISGSTGLIGTVLVRRLTELGHEVTRLIRGPGKYSEPTIAWNPNEMQLESSALEGFDAVVHLAGESIAGGRWTGKKKAKIHDSRIKSTTLLSQTLAGLQQPPAVFISASAMDYYGDRGDEILTEEKPPGDGFLADVCREWEAACQPAVEKGIRVVNPRTTIVLSSRGGALARMLLPFKLGVGGRIGNGRQYWSWISLDDEVNAIAHLLLTDTISGPVNLGGPEAVTNREFTNVLGKVLRRPTIIPIPAFFMRLLFGEMADALLLSSKRISSEKLRASGFTFAHPTLEEALRSSL